nr:substrate-binding domain-containing protein [Pedobacter sp. BS3]
MAGATQIVADETFEPILEDQLFVFSSSYPDARIKMIYQPEAGVVNSLLNNPETRIAVLSRKLNNREQKVFDNRKIRVRVNRIAIDAVTLIVNQASADTAVTVNDIVNVLQGKPSPIKKLVFDNANSSTVRYLKELSNVTDVPASGVYALKNNKEVIKYIYNNKGAIGVVGFNWIEQPDKDMEEAVSKIRVLGVKNLAGKPGDDKFYKPNQTNLALSLYPLKREVFIINCQGGPGLGTGFAAFVASDRGQRIILKSGLLPDSIPSREIIIRK